MPNAKFDAKSFNAEAFKYIIADTQINGKEENLVLGADSIPVRGDINGSPR